MLEIDAYSFFWIGDSLWPLRNLIPGTLVSGAWVELAIAKNALKVFAENPLEGMPHLFPNTAAKAKELSETLNELVPDNLLTGFTDRRISELEVQDLQNAANQIAHSFKDESRHAYTLAVQDQRGYSAYILVEKIENCFSKESWQTIEQNAKREFEETGKCLAFERYTAAGFHALRAVECVIRQCIVKLTGALPTKRDWGNYITILENNGVDRKITAVLDNIRSLERNPLMHPEDWLDLDDALGIFTISQTAITRLCGVLKGTP